MRTDKGHFPIKLNTVFFESACGRFMLYSYSFIYIIGQVIYFTSSFPNRYSFFPNLTLLMDQYEPIYEGMGYDRSVIEGYVDQMKAYISTPWFSAGNMKKRSVESTLHEEGTLQEGENVESTLNREGTLQEEGDNHIDTIVQWNPEDPGEYLSAALNMKSRKNPFSISLSRLCTSKH